MHNFLNILIGAGILQEEAGTDGAAAGGGNSGQPAATTTAPNTTTTSAAPNTTPATDAKDSAKTDEAAGAKEDAAPEATPHAMDQYIEQHADNPAVSLALTFLRDNGVNPDDPAFQMAEQEGNFDLLAALLEQKGAAGTDKFLGILKGAVEEYQGKVAEQEQRTTEIITETLGEDLNPIFDWVRENADEGEKQMINEMLACGGLAAKGAALVLRELYTGSGNTVAAKSVTTSNTNQSTQGLTRAQFTEAVTKLGRSGENPRNHPSYASLWQQRQLGMKNGI